MAGRPHKSAHDLGAGQFTQGQRKQMIEIEQALQGNSELLQEIPNTLSERGIEYYLTILKHLNPSILASLDRSIIEQLANNYDRLDTANAYLNNNDNIIYDKEGTPKGAHPYVKIQRDLVAEQVVLNAQLGISPKNRAEFTRSVTKDAKEVINSAPQGSTEYEKAMQRMIEQNKE
ncbi:hypothetical protein BUY79_12590 [Staphylococcus equorum]|uniref:P27 family phage terminase small subunit n=1 Tax=Staphylococcus equorum TaxID=246432 RepID=UPI000D1C3C1B|nr:P27 family phage terminase small subunit [Staphylococcus equorum]PTE82519.1 hypothetical protein BUY79_12590 [Staphylococcus equorum]